MTGKRRIQAPNGDVANSAEPHRSSSSKPKLVGHSDHIELQQDESDAGIKLQKKRAKKRKKESKKNGTRDADVSFVSNLVDAEESMKATKPAIPANGITMPTAQTDNLVLRKLLRGPRYFDPSDESWGICYNCGEQGHRTIDCVVGKKKKKCFLCGSTEHTFKKCKKERGCVICKRKGHKTKDCPEKNIKLRNGSVAGKICLRCGDCGHDMFSCKNSYFLIDLKAIRCYTCNGFSHLCCYASADHVSKNLSCYKCGGLGHTSMACARLAGEASSMRSSTLCYNCRLGGHFARECPNLIMGSKSSDRDASSRSRKIRSVEDDVTTHRESRRVGLITENLPVSPMPCRKISYQKRRMSYFRRPVGVTST